MASSSIKIDVRVDIDRALRKLRVTEDEARKAIPRALNKTATTARAQAAREIKQAGYSLKISDIKAAISIAKATRSKLVATLTASGRPIPLVQYRARQRKDGVSVNVLNGQKVIKHAFIATMPSGHKGVFVRVGTGHKRVMRDGKRVPTGLPIRELYGPSIPSAFANKTVQAAMDRVIRERLAVVLDQELRYVVSRR